MLRSIKYQEFQLCLGSEKPLMLFFLLQYVKMPTIVGILTFTSRENFMLNSVEKSFITSGPDVKGQSFLPGSKLFSFKADFH